MSGNDIENGKIRTAHGSVSIGSSLWNCRAGGDDAGERSGNHEKRETGGGN